jgi:hypothetical protein
MIGYVVAAAIVATGVAVVRRLQRSGPPASGYSEQDQQDVRTRMTGRSHTHGHY